MFLIDRPELFGETEWKVPMEMMMAKQRFTELTMKMNGKDVIPILIDLKSVEAVYPNEKGKAFIQLSRDVRYLLDQQYEFVKGKVVQYQLED